MKVTFFRDDLANVLACVSGVVEKRQTLPILGNLLFEVSGDSVAVTATDLEIEVRAKGNCNAPETGEFTLSARKFGDICRTLPVGSEIGITLTGEKAAVSSGKSRFSLGVLPASDFPRMEVAGGVREIKIPESLLKRLIERTAFAMAQQDVRYYLNGMLLEVDGNQIRSVATDGHRLATWTGPITGEGELGGVQILLPRKAVTELYRMLKDSPDEISLEIGGTFARINKKEFVFSTKLVDGRYPDWNRVIPRALERSVKVDRVLFRDALIRASILSSEKYRGISLTFGAGSLKLTAHNPEKEQAEDEIDIDYDAGEVSVGFNVGYLLDVLNVLEGENVVMDFSDGASSAVIKEEGNDSGVYVVMPMRL